MATRLYFSSAQAAPVSPAYGGWDETAFGQRKALLLAKASGDILDVAEGVNAGAGSGLMSQFVSGPLESQTISGSVKSYLRALDNVGANDVLSILLIRACNGDGSAYRGTLLAIFHYGPSTAWAGSFTNRVFADGDALSSLAVMAGDRLVVEAGFYSLQDFSSGGAAVYIGAPDGTSDLPENETETGNLVPWIEFSGDITFQAAAAGKNLLLLGVG
jgi:hypothetical protein